MVNSNSHEKLPGTLAVVATSIWDGCDPGVAAAIRNLIDSWKPYSTKSRRYSMYRLFREIVGPAWLAYVDVLPAQCLGRRLALEVELAACLHEGGFEGIATRLERLVLDFHLLAYPDIERASTIADFTVHIPCRQRDETVEFVFEQTIASLISIAGHSARKRPQSSIAVDHVNAVRGNEHCRCCGEPSEVLFYLRSDLADREKHWPHDHGNLVPSLSGQYCRHHRPRNHDGSWNPEYKRATRSERRFALEASRLTKQSASTSRRIVSSGAIATDLFYLAVINQTLRYPDEQKALRNLANQLVRSKVSDMKKAMVTLRAAGLTQAEISRRLGVSQQAVSKALAKVPHAYRYDLPVTA